MTKPLLVCFKPRDIPEFGQAVSKLKIDKLWMKYFPQDEAYRLAREFFLNSDYTHFMILPDDLIVTQKDVDIISNYDEAFDSISGWCNNTSGNTLDVDSDISLFSPPNPPRISTYEGYRWMTIKEIEDILSKKYDDMPSFATTNGEHIRIPVLHQGFALTRLSRKVIEQVPFRTDAGCCVDSCMSIDLSQKGILQFVDLRVKTLHKKIPWTEILVGREKAVMVLEKHDSG